MLFVKDGLYLVVGENTFVPVTRASETKGFARLPPIPHFEAAPRSKLLRLTRNFQDIPSETKGSVRYIQKEKGQFSRSELYRGQIQTCRCRA